MARGRGQTQSPMTLLHLKPPEKGYPPFRRHSHRTRSWRSQPRRDADRVEWRGRANALSVVMARHAGIEPTWARLSLAARILCPAVFSPQVPVRKKTGGREGRSRSLKKKLSASNLVVTSEWQCSFLVSENVFLISTIGRVISDIKNVIIDINN